MKNPRYLLFIMRFLLDRLKNEHHVPQNDVVERSIPWRCVSFCERSEHDASVASHTVVHHNKVARVGASPQKRVAVLKVLGPAIVSSS